MRILGLDFGSKTVGVAVSDPTGLIASGVEIIRRDREDKLRKTLSRIEELIVQYVIYIGTETIYLFLRLYRFPIF